MKAKPKMKKAKAIKAWGVAWFDLDGSLNGVTAMDTREAAESTIARQQRGDACGPFLARVTVEPYV